MRILDRYVLGGFLRNYLISFFVLVGMYVVLDMVFNFDEFVPTQAAKAGGGIATVWATFAGVVDYYFYQSFLIFVHLSGIIPVVAAAFTFIRMSRNNELTALLAAGVTLKRVAMPVILVAVVLNALVLVDTEVVIPNMIPQLVRRHGDVVDDLGGGKGAGKGFVLRHYRDGTNLVNAARYVPGGKEAAAHMAGVEVVLRDGEFNPVGRLVADGAAWDAGAKRWRLNRGQVTTGVGRAAVTKPVGEYEGASPEDVAAYRVREQRAYPIRAIEGADRTLLVATKYFPPTGTRAAEIETLDLIFRDKDTLDPISHLTADAATWDAKTRKWVLVNGRLVRGLLPGQKREAETKWAAYETNITPDEIALYRSREFVELLPTRRINELLSGPNSYGTAELLRVKHFRFTQPLINVVLLLLAIPCVLLREPGGIKLAATKLLVLSGLCMGSVFLAQQMAGNVPAGMAGTWPALMAWVPIFVFGPLAVFLLDRVKT